MEEPQEKGGGEMMREFRKGNWTVEETMILIEAKRMDDQRRRMSKSKSAMQQQPLRWKWVEEYCWRRGCQRSQNQCNDKWDNLMRDYKKVRDYQRNLSEITNTQNVKSYWEMDRGERKEKGLPTNMLPQIYQALYDVVERQPMPPPVPPPVPAATTTTSVAAIGASSSAAVVITEMPLVPVALLAQPPPPPRLPRMPTPALAYYSPQQQQSQPSPTLGSESEHSDSESPAKKRKGSITTREQEEGEEAEAEEEEEEEAAARGVRGETSEAAAATATAIPTTTTTTTRPMGTGPTTTSITTDHLQEVGNSISRSARIITEAIQGSEEREERRHREIVDLHHTTLRLQESRMEIHRQGFNALTDAINNLTNSILHWANSHKNQGP